MPALHDVVNAAAAQHNHKRQRQRQRQCQSTPCGNALSAARPLRCKHVHAILRYQLFRRCVCPVHSAGLGVNVQDPGSLMVASMLNRTIVLPRVASLCEHFFYPGKDCIIEGHRVRLPYVLPTNHWLRAGSLKLPHREPGFLDNPRVPISIRESTVTIAPCEGASCVSTDSKELRVARRLGSSALQIAATSIADKSVVHVNDVLNLAAKFDTKEQSKYFIDATDKILCAFCCLKNVDQEKYPGVEVLQAPYAWRGPPRLISDSAPEAIKCNA